MHVTLSNGRTVDVHNAQEVCVLFEALDCDGLPFFVVHTGDGSFIQYHLRGGDVRGGASKDILLELGGGPDGVLWGCRTADSMSIEEIRAVIVRYVTDGAEAAKKGYDWIPVDLELRIHPFWKRWINRLRGTHGLSEPPHS
jgi:hypothetical protein